MGAIDPRKRKCQRQPVLGRRPHRTQALELARRLVRHRRRRVLWVQPGFGHAEDPSLFLTRRDFWAIFVSTVTTLIVPHGLHDLHELLQLASRQGW